MRKLYQLIVPALLSLALGYTSQPVPWDHRRYETVVPDIGSGPLGVERAVCRPAILCSSSMR